MGRVPTLLSEPRQERAPKYPSVVYTEKGEGMNMEEHECEFLSACCDAYPPMGIYETGICGRCHEHTGFECSACGDIESEVKG